LNDYIGTINKYFCFDTYFLFTKHNGIEGIYEIFNAYLSVFDEYFWLEQWYFWFTRKKVTTSYKITWE